MAGKFLALPIYKNVATLFKVNKILIPNSLVRVSARKSDIVDFSTFLFDGLLQGTSRNLRHQLLIWSSR